MATAEDSGDFPAMVSFSDRELLALFPAAPPLGVPPPWAAHRFDDPARAARQALPLTPKAMLEALAPSPGLRKIAALGILLRPYAKFALPHWFALQLVFYPPLATCWVYGRESFGTKNLAVATAAVVFQFVSSGFVFAVSGFMMRDVNQLKAGERDEEVNGQPAAEIMDDDSMAPLARWFQLTRANGGAESKDAEAHRGASLLAAHAKGDSYCPCSGLSCLGSLPTRVITSVVAFFSLSFFGAMVAYPFLENYSALVTLAEDTWTHAWSAASCVLLLVVQFSYFLLAQFTLLRNNSGLRAVSLETRLQVRAFRLALGSLVDRFHHAEQLGTDIPPASRVEPADRELYVTLYRALSPTWSLRVAEDSHVQTMSVGLFFVTCIQAVFYVAGGSCFPAYLVMGIVFYVVNGFVQLIGLARSNAKIDAANALLHRTRAELRLLVLRLGPGADPALRTRAGDNIAVMSSALEGSELRATFLGTPVSMGLIRTVAATLLTVAVGVFGLLRGAGVYLTLENVCWA
ncbi:hypothetical protein DFJ74DRAFT_713842 [Hyaloraphidium curvatum]|nr:hypothetical protein DFJ74DRAFT_713842 [Hyaloraphidium curvatum]